MKKRKLALTGQINAQGRLLFYTDALKDWAQQFQNEKILLSVEVLPKEQSKLLLAYYKNYVLPEFQNAIREQGEWLSIAQVDERLRTASPLMEVATYNIETGVTSYRVKELEELHNADFCEFLEWLKMYAAENYSLYIEDPN